MSSFRGGRSNENSSDTFGMWLPRDCDGRPPSRGIPPITSRHPTVGGSERNNVPDLSRRRIDSLPSPNDGGPFIEKGLAKDNYKVITHWDFGILLADREKWRRWKDEHVIDPAAPGTRVTVGMIWNRLCIKRSLLLQDEAWPCPRDYRPSWPAFLSACDIVANREKLAPFDVDLSTDESLNCLLLEMWASGICSHLNENDLKDLSVRRSEETPHTLRTLLGRYAPSLYSSMVLLVSHIQHYKRQGWGLTRKHVSAQASASREWYHTASARLSGGEESSLTLLALPGSFSTRGDWGFAVASGSRSRRLGHLALDQVLSRRLSIVRLHDGIGLPSRDVATDSRVGDLLTAIRCSEPHGPMKGKTTSIKYREMAELGHSAVESGFAGDGINWLWRSRIDNYDRDTFLFRRWLVRMIEEQDVWITSPAVMTVETDSVDLYSENNEFEIDDVNLRRNFSPEFNEFLDRVELLRSVLRN